MWATLFILDPMSGKGIFLDASVSHLCFSHLHVWWQGLIKPYLHWQVIFAPKYNFMAGLFQFDKCRMAHLNSGVG